MKHMIAMVLFLTVNSAVALPNCQFKEESQDVNTPVPKELEGSVVIIRTKDGKETQMKSEDYKVVKRKQQFKIKKQTITEREPCEPTVVTVEHETVREVYRDVDETKNLIMLGVRVDHVDLDGSATGNTARIYDKRGPVFDLSYYRKSVFKSRIGAGLGLDTNLTPRAMIGIDF
jgi:hypothetical protein